MWFNLVCMYVIIAVFHILFAVLQRLLSWSYYLYNMINIFTKLED